MPQGKKEADNNSMFQQLLQNMNQQFSKQSHDPKHDFSKEEQKLFDLKQDFENKFDYLKQD